MITYFYSFLIKFDKYLKRTLIIIGSLVFISTFIILSLQVFLRNSPFRSLIWAEEFGRYFTILFVCLIIPVLSSKREHPKIDLFVNYLPVKARNIKIFIADITGVIFSYFLFSEGVDHAIHSFGTYSPSLRWSYGILYSFVPISAFLTMIFLIINLMLELFEITNYDKSDK